MQSLTSFSYNTLYALGSYYYSRISGKLKQDQFAIFSLILMASSILFMAFSPSAIFIILFNGVFGMSIAFISPLMAGMIINYLMKDNIGITRTNVISSLGIIFGYIFAAFGGALFSSKDLMFINTAFTLAVLPLVKYFPEKFKTKGERRALILSLMPQVAGRIRAIPHEIVKYERELSFKALYNDFKKMFYFKKLREMPTVLLGATVLYTAIQIFFTPMPSYLKIFGYTDSDIYTLYLINNFTTLLLYDFMRKRTETESGTWKLLIIAVMVRPILFLFPLLTYLKVPINLIFVIFYIGIGISWSGISVALPVLIMKNADPESKGLALSKMNATTTIGTIVGSFVGGIVSKYYFITGTSILASLMALVSLAIFFKASKIIPT